MPFKWMKENIEEMEQCGVTKFHRDIALGYFLASIQKRRTMLQPGDQVDPADFFESVLKDSLALLTEDTNKAVARMDITFIQGHPMIVHAMHHLAADSVVQARYDASRAAFEAAVEELVNS